MTRRIDHSIGIFGVAAMMLAVDDPYRIDREIIVSGGREPGERAHRAYRTRSKIKQPHQGSRECERRRRQLAKKGGAA